MRRTLTAGAFIAVAAASPASAATVEVVREGTGPLTGERATLKVSDTAGEPNVITVSVAGEVSGELQYVVRDDGAALTAGAGCTGGGPPGSPAECLLPRTRPADCVRTFCTDQGRRVTLDFELGEGADALDTGSVPAGDGGGGVFETAAAGAGGDDRFSMGSGSDMIDPGPGADVIHGGDGGDRALAGEAAADGADLIELGAGFDTADYGRATMPVMITPDANPDDGVAGDGDNVISAESLIGGSGADRIVGSDSRARGEPDGYDELLEGGPGDDLILGRGGRDYISGDPESSVGDDMIAGGPGADVIYPRDGDDDVAGGAGGDQLYAESGADVVRGGAGGDIAWGGNGADRVTGGTGRDTLDGDDLGRDGDQDHLNCGPDRDFARAEPRDRTAHCERIKVQRR